MIYCYNKIPLFSTVRKLQIISFEKTSVKIDGLCSMSILPFHWHCDASTKALLDTVEINIDIPRSHVK